MRNKEVSRCNCALDKEFFISSIQKEVDDKCPVTARQILVVHVIKGMITIRRKSLFQFT